MSDALKREELRTLAAQLQSAREDERRALARELHDDLGQALTAMKLDLAWIKRRMMHFEDPARRYETIGKACELDELIDGAINTVQRISTDLRPALLDMLGLWPALEAEAARFASRTGIDCSVRPCGDTWKPSTEKVSVELFRIVQEALTNIVRHARASSVEISCRSSRRNRTLSIVDNGRGISLAEAESPSSLGLIGMRERALSFGGEISATGSPGAGTRVTVTIPASAVAGGR
jgi:two-component system sensor histidine kinase UhpB